MNEEQLKTAYYLTGWKLLVYRLFMKWVYPALKDGHAKHQALIEHGYIVHIDKKCPVCE